MGFFRWLKSLFSKPANQSNSTISAPKPVTSKGWKDEWNTEVKRLVLLNLNTFNLASDIHNIRPDWSLLSNDQKSEVMAEFFKALAYYESGYDPLSESVDVGTIGNKESWSVGLLQLSGDDKKNLSLAIGYDYEGLKDPIKNIQQGVAIMINQIKKRGKMIIPKSEKGNPGVYWAVLNPGNQYDKSDKIISAVQAVKFENKEQKEPETLPTKPVSNDTPWRDWFLARKGWTEFSHDKELSKGWKLTKYCKNFTTVIGKANSWCGMSLATALNSCGYSIPEQCETAFEFKKYGTPIDWKRNGIPKGAIVVLSTSHVTTADRYHLPTENTFYGLGGNQGNSINVSYYPMENIEAVRWPVKMS